MTSSGTPRSTGPVPALTPIDQRVADLGYHLLLGRLPADRYPILAERRLDLGWAVATLRIVGASHTCELALPQTVVAEALVAGLSLEGAGAPHLLHAPATVEYQTQIVIEPDLSVDLCLSPAWLDEAEFARSEFVLARAAETALVAHYPHCSHHQAGLTRLEWSIAHPPIDGFTLVTYHTYPRERAVVWTRTRFAQSARGTAGRA